VFGSEIKAVIADPRVPKKPDDEGLADFLLISSRPVDGAERTCFRGIHALLPSCLALITPKRLTIRRYWDFDPARQIRFPSTDQYVEAFRERFAEAVRRRLRSAYPVAVAVSGGLDSSSIFCQAQRLLAADVNRPPPLVGISFVGAPGGPGDERRYLNEIAREYHARLESFDAEPLAGILRGATEQMRLTEAPLFDYLWGITSELDRRAAAAGARVLLGGHWGDQVLFSSAYLVDLFNRGAWHRIRSHLREFARWSGAMEARALTRRFYVDLARHHLPRAVLPVLKRVRRRLMGIERPKEWFASAFLEHALVHADQPATLGNGFHSAQARAIYFEARSKYHVHCLEWHNKIDAWHGLDAALPMMDRDLLAFLMAIPGEVQNANGVPRAILRSAMRGILPETIRCRASKGDFSYLVNDGVAGDAARLARVLSPESLGVEMGYFNPVRLRPAVDRLAERSRASAECIDSWDLADMFGLEMWLQVFFPRSPKTPDALGRSEETLHDEAESHGSSPQKATLSNTAVAHLR
jgi:asparagine synthase (glutamine-hydrolysing)